MKILLVEDDEIIASGLFYVFEAEGHEVVYCEDYKKALKAARDKELSLAVLDLSLPDGSGFDICAALKEWLGIPVIFLTAVDDEANIVKGLDMGADDYITKPFRVKELMARINAVMRRSSSKTSMRSDIINIVDIEINKSRAKVYKRGAEVLLTAIEYRLLLTLAENKGQVMTRNQILARLWDSDGEYVNDNTLTVNIKRLREKLGDDVLNPVIQTVRGIGYKIGDS